LIDMRATVIQHQDDGPAHIVGRTRYCRMTCQPWSAATRA
jgi:hypothetical protein